MPDSSQAGHQGLHAGKAAFILTESLTVCIILPYSLVTLFWFFHGVFGMLWLIAYVHITFFSVKKTVTFFQFLTELVEIQYIIHLGIVFLSQLAHSCHLEHYFIGVV